jgi:hypothetical protein
VSESGIGSGVFRGVKELFEVGLLKSEAFRSITDAVGRCGSGGGVLTPVVRLDSGVGLFEIA